MLTDFHLFLKSAPIRAKGREVIRQDMRSVFSKGGDKRPRGGAPKKLLVNSFCGCRIAPVYSIFSASRRDVIIEERSKKG